MSPFTNPEQNQAYFEQMEFRPAECVGRMVLTIERAEVLFALLREAIEGAHAAKQRNFFAQLDEFLAQQGLHEEFQDLIKAQIAKREPLLNNQEASENGASRDAESARE